MSSAATSAGNAEPPFGASRLVTIPSASQPTDARQLCAELEAGNLLFFPQTPFQISPAEGQILLGQKQSSAAYHKNVAYRPIEDRVTGLDQSESAEAEQLRVILQNYSRSAAKLVDTLLSPYRGEWKLDFASYRPVEERGRPARLHARNDLCHVDAFPTRPTNGDRILRVFTNINPAQNRIWLTAETFEAVGPHFAKVLGLPAARNTGPLSRALRALARAAHLPGARRSPYDDFMHRCHNAMKEDERFQNGSPKQRWEFPPNSTWLVFTDCVSHAVLEGQYALEQTFIVSRRAMVTPHRAPVAILERIAGHPLTA